mgnify:CR=1 FL=1
MAGLYDIPDTFESIKIGGKFMSDLQTLDEIAVKAEQVKILIGLTHREDVTKEQYNAVLYIVSDYMIDIIKLAEGEYVE